MRLTFRTLLINPDGWRLSLSLPADGAPLWRQPGETAKAFADTHPDHAVHGPWTVVSTERSA